MTRLHSTALLSVCFLWFTGLVQAQITVPDAPDLSARGYILIDAMSDRTLAAKSQHERLHPASITKLMTAYVTFRALNTGQVSLQDQVLISEKAWRTQGSRMFVEVGTRVTVEDLLQGMIIQSGNDASVALSEYIAGTEETFTQLMNQHAAELGMVNTNYENSTGLPARDHYTSAADIALLAKALINEFPEFYRWYSQKEFTYNKITQKNRNALLWRDPTVDGMKTGMTDAAGYCLVSSALRDEMRLIAVVLGTKSASARAKDSQALLNYGFRFYETRLLYSAGNSMTEARVWKGTEESTGIGVQQDLYVTIPRGSYDKLEANMDLPQQLIAPIDESMRLGKVRVSLNSEPLAEANLFALTAVNEGSLWQIARDSLLMWFE